MNGLVLISSKTYCGEMTFTSFVFSLSSSFDATAANNVRLLNVEAGDSDSDPWLEEAHVNPTFLHTF